MATTVGAAGYSSQQPAQYLPTTIITPPTRIWLTSGNTDVVIDASVGSGSCIVVTPTSIPAGFWKVVVGAGNFTVTSSDSESAGLTYNYTIFS